MPVVQLHSLSDNTPVGWGCRLHWLHLCKGIRYSKCPGYDTEQYDGKAPALELWGIQSTPSLPLFPDPLWT